MILIIVAFTSVASFMSSSGMYDITLPVTGFVMGDNDASTIQQNALGQSSSDLNWLEIIRMFVAVIGECALACLTVIPLLGAFGFPPLMVGPILGPIQTIVIITGLYELWTGRSIE